MNIKTNIIQKVPYLVIITSIFLVLMNALGFEITDIAFAQETVSDSHIYYVDNTKGVDTNLGTEDQPLKTINKGLNLARAGDIVYIRAGTYLERIIFLTEGSDENQRVTLKAYNSEQVIIKNKGRVMDITKPYLSIEGIIFDGDWGDDDAVRVAAEAHYLKLNKCEIRNTRRDAIDIGSPQGVLIQDCLIHDAIWVDGITRADAHGIVTYGVKDMTIKNTEIYYVSGDAIQLQYHAWDNVIIEGCKLWNGPLPSPRGGAPEGVYPGENAIDTKYYVSDGRGKLTIKDTIAYGWRSSYITNAAAFNIKHNVEAVFDGVTTYDNEICFRLRGPSSTSTGDAWVTIKNAVIYGSDKGIRYEDKIEHLHVYNCTWGNGVFSLFQSAGGYGQDFLVKNCLFLADTKPSEASDSSNMAVDQSSFINASANVYYLSEDSPAIDNGVFLEEVTVDRDKVIRPKDVGYDIGAYEYNAEIDLICDVTADGVVNVLDVQLCVNVVLGIETDSDRVKKADVNGDGGVDVLDIQEIVNEILNSG